jgi:hypothetical protein
MLFDVAGIFVAFAATMLLLSLIVTAINQAVQAVFRIRGRNLRYGLASALSGADVTPPKESTKLADEILNNSDAAALRRAKNPTSLMSTLKGPAATWIEPDALKEMLELAITDNPGLLSSVGVKLSVDEIVTNFKRLDAPLRNRFRTTMQVVSIISGLLIALLFQLSAPHFVQDLSTDPERRAAYITATQNTLDRTQQAANALNDRQVSRELLEAQLEVAAVTAQSATQTLAIIDIVPLRHGMTYYTQFPAAASHIVGVLMTAILISLGAPFWYQALQKGIRWRDLFAGGSPAGNNDQQTKT